MRGNEDKQLIADEASAVKAMMDSVIDIGRARGIDLMGIDSPALAVKATLGSWVVAARSYKPVSMASKS